MIPQSPSRPSRSELLSRPPDRPVGLRLPHSNTEQERQVRARRARNVAAVDRGHRNARQASDGSADQIASLKPLATRNATFFDALLALIWISSPVAGLRRRIEPIS